jgi:hypothetical protein
MPYAGSSVNEVVAAAREGAVRAVSELEPQVPPALGAICGRAMAKQPQDRYRNATELATALEEFEAAAVLAKPPSRLLSAAVFAVTGLAVVVATFGLAAMLRFMPSMDEMGPGPLLVLMVGIGGLFLGATEWRSQGRYQLADLSLAFAGMTFCVGIFVFLINVSVVFAQMLKAGDDLVRYRGLFTQGIWESIGVFMIAMGLTVPQVLLWGLARRRVATGAPSVAPAARTTRR